MSITIKNFFPDLDKFRYRDIFAGVIYPWEVIKKIIPFIEKTLSEMSDESTLGIETVPAFQYSQLSSGEKMIFVERPVRLTAPFFLRAASIYIGKGTLLEPGSLLKSSVIIGESCEVRQGAYLREGLITGNACVLGHTTETKNSIFMDHVEAGHFSYVGDSVLGRHVNLGAGTKLANLQLRTPEEKDTGDIREVRIKIERVILETGLNKLGAIIGDYGDIGCNTVTSPGALLASNCRVYPNTTVKKGYFPSQSTIN